MKADSRERTQLAQSHMVAQWQEVGASENDSFIPFPGSKGRLLAGPLGEQCNGISAVGTGITYS